ncbi:MULTISPECIES: hypothetical protein [Actinosynnema]|uniref:hypothetical protein n=1 Tax=Actinosynnema TaxID=40566 RepID=UPI0020A56004|nr:hypothetical protein [Actinosynnema pretiosum]MCP2099426.1 hypothetical protein [Actinosynnema pretiosum]
MSTVSKLDARIRALETRLNEVSGTQDIVVERMAAQIDEIHRGMSLILTMLTRDPELAKSADRAQQEHD